MDNSLESLQRLRRFNEDVRSRDTQLAEESMELARAELTEAVTPRGALEDDVELESIVMRTQRPVLAIRDNDAVLEFRDAGDSQVWKARLQAAKPFLHDAIRAVGRIELTGSPYSTGSARAGSLHDSILVTNRHVANEFAMRKGDGFVLQDGPIGSRSGRPSTSCRRSTTRKRSSSSSCGRCHIEDEPGPDVAFFEIEIDSGNDALAKPIAARDRPTATENVAVIGYPAYDSRIPDVDLMERIYGKDLQQEAARAGRRDARRGTARPAQLHDARRQLRLRRDRPRQPARRSACISAAAFSTDQLRGARRRGEASSRRRALPAGRGPRRRSAEAPRRAQLRRRAERGRSWRSASVTIPLTVTVSLGDARSRAVAAQPACRQRWRATTTPARSKARRASSPTTATATATGPQFLGNKFAVPLPSVERGANDVLEFDNDGATDTELRYEHYSVVMSRSRRMCFFSAVNIDGNLSKKSARVAWKWDPRIPKAQQIMNECYGSPPKFSRGHMTRREDPGWGDARDRQARQRGLDARHQHHAADAGLQRADLARARGLRAPARPRGRHEDLGVHRAVFRRGTIPMMYGVKIPRTFWKVIAFIHDETGKLCATGYEMTQKQSLQPEEEFVFGAFQSPQLNVATQVSIRSIETRSGLRFGNLGDVDPLADDEEGVVGSGPRSPLLALEQIRFIG